MQQSDRRNELLSTRSGDSYMFCSSILTEKIYCCYKWQYLHFLPVKCLRKIIDLIETFFLFHVVWVCYHTFSQGDWTGSPPWEHWTSAQLLVVRVLSHRWRQQIEDWINSLFWVLCFPVCVKLRSFCETCSLYVSICWHKLPQNNSINTIL